MLKNANLPRKRANNQSYLVLNNVAKESNFGFLLRTANAFGAIPLVVGKKRYSRGGACAGTGKTPVHHFFSLEPGIAFAREQGCRICGIEITHTAAPIENTLFTGPTAFIVGNEGSGLSDRQKSFCDFFTYIPQYGNAVSLNLNVATGIVLQKYAVWAGYTETPRDGEKFKSPTIAKPEPDSP